MDPYQSYYSPGVCHRSTAMTNYAAFNPPYELESSQFFPSGPGQAGRCLGQSQTSDADDVHMDQETLSELTVKVFERGGTGGGKNYVLRNVQVGSIRNNLALQQFLLNELGSKVSGKPEKVDIGYFKGNKRIWMHTAEEYINVLERLCHGSQITLWCEHDGSKTSKKRRVSDEQSDLDNDEESQKGLRSKSKRQKGSLSEEKNARVQEIFEKLKAKHGDTYTGPQYRLWAEAIDVEQHSSYDEHPKVRILVQCRDVLMVLESPAQTNSPQLLLL